MCGIVGWTAFRRTLENQRAVVQTMNDTMALRGPDAEGIWLSRHAALGHRRLAVIDIEGGTQPMTAQTAHGTVAITYSGETYNFTELRSELRCRGHVFHTHSDTEVVLRSYLEWGASFVHRLNGMYALAIWDDRSETLLLTRDRLGIKPLYYYPTEDGVIFGSEPKALLAHPMVKPVIDTDGLRNLFGFVRPPGQAIWAGMHEVRPGTTLQCDSVGIREHTYWKLELNSHHDDAHATTRKVRELLEDIVPHQLVADVPRCALLSGGLDSSGLTALAGRHLKASGQELSTYTVDFVQSQDFTPNSLHATRDAPYARQVAKHVGTAHQDIRLRHDQLSDPEVRRAVVIARDAPFGLGDPDHSLYLLFKALREHSTVALSGEAADEVFGGYPWLHDTRVQQTAMFPWITTFIDDPSHHTTTFIDPSLFHDTLRLREYWSQQYTDMVADVAHIAGETAHERRMREFNYAHLTRWLRILLDRKDRISMAVGLEVRVPFCDHRLVEYIYNTPWSLKTYDGQEKSLLRGAFHDLLPPSVLRRTKALFPMTQEEHYVTTLQSQVTGLLTEGHQAVGFFDRGALAEAANLEPQAVPKDARHAFERVLDLAVWFSEYSPEIRLG
ncbi:asparagine synthase (glutamine-hydrolyzing) [Streptomyces flavofungini]|uniref:asparagine synthase (glutamine-hydrolyzing) n=1 Tax=Streptomyces flavofungini TaxID=68200 RepID=A0ABS0XJA2_9ACTN|nr:asparagine synthase (glutamine-hydrolyzing) [Streptomyces flavofungini]MBJ3813309.1 asparagine synthase (glutamine-hydrolyzing) [Streptomyces flavofungini]GHC91289.1 asparagine synthetase B [Streptomyces flavofungini]